VAELYGKHGAEHMRRYIDRMLDATEARMRSRIRAVLKEGVYSAQDWLDEDGITGAAVRFAVTLTVRDGHITLDCSECAAQIGSGKNVPYAHTLATAFFCLRAIVDPQIVTNEGLYRTVTVVAPEGSIVNPIAPAAVSSRNTTSMILADVFFNVLGQAGPDRAIAACGPAQGIILAGHDPLRARYFVDYENFAGGQGGRGQADGMDVVQVNMTNTSNLPIEAMEMEFPLRVERYELVADSAGAGKFRGGLGVMRDLRVLADEATVALRSARQAVSAQGLAGGGPGGLGAFIRNPGQPGEMRLPSTSSETPLKRGDVLRIVTPGGGGFGQPRERDPRAIERDLQAGKITAQAADTVYGRKPV
jgi:N-methylhydantoinase B